MSSPFVRHRGLSQKTLDAHHRLVTAPQTVRKTVDFFCFYLRDVAPLGVTIHYIPVDPNARRPATRSNPTREEILLMTDQGKIFMSGLVSVAKEDAAADLEKAAGDEASANWQKGECAEDAHRRFFTGQTTLRVFNNRGADAWQVADTFDPIPHADHVAAFLQREFDLLEMREYDRSRRARRA